MVDLEIGGDFEGTSGNFKIKSDFPIFIKPCDSVVDRLKLKNMIKYIRIHGEENGVPSVEETEITVKK